MKADIAIEFVKDYEWERNGVAKFTAKGSKMVGSPEFLDQFIKAKVAKDVTGKLNSIKEELEKIVNDKLEE